MEPIGPKKTRNDISDKKKNAPKNAIKKHDFSDRLFLDFFLDFGLQVGGPWGVGNRGFR